MLKELDIKNFRLFKHLHIEGLKRVNLFAGKNNSGKTALLEALRIRSAEDDISVMRYILQQRGEYFSNFWSLYDSFFFRPELERLQKDTNKSLTFEISDDFVFSRKYITEKRVEYMIGTNTQSFDVSQLGQNLPQPLFPRDRVVYVPFSAVEHFPLSYYWDQIVLTPKEDKVIEILRETILPDLIRLDVQQNERIMVRLKSEEKPVPLKNLGDGAQRMLAIAIALVSAKDNLLLIDEIETGLHFTVLEKMWDIIFRYSESLHIQVFATTHSQDALKTFAYMLEKSENEDAGAYFRLQADRKTGQIEAIPFDLERLESALETKSEIR